VVTAKVQDAAVICLESVGITADAVRGWCHGEEKTAALREHGAHVYVGDTGPDMQSARGAGAYAVGVTTGPDDAAALTQAGADVVVADLHAACDAIAVFGRW
jgi:phosphoglycolate phosphatase